MSPNWPQNCHSKLAFLKISDQKKQQDTEEALGEAVAVKTGWFAHFAEKTGADKLCSFLLGNANVSMLK